MEGKIQLAHVIESLREELLKAVEAGDGQALRFAVEEVTVEAQVMVTQELGGKAGVKFWVLNGELGGSEQASRMQKVVLKLQPKQVKPGEEAPAASDEVLLSAEG